MPRRGEAAFRNYIIVLYYYKRFKIYLLPSALSKGRCHRAERSPRVPNDNVLPRRIFGSDGLLYIRAAHPARLISVQADRRIRRRGRRGFRQHVSTTGKTGSGCVRSTQAAQPFFGSAHTQSPNHFLKIFLFPSKQTSEITKIQTFLQKSAKICIPLFIPADFYSIINMYTYTAAKQNIPPDNIIQCFWMIIKR